MIIPSEASLPGFNLLCSLLLRPLSPLKLGLDMRLLYAVDVKKKELVEMLNMLKSSETLTVVPIFGSDYL